MSLKISKVLFFFLFIFSPLAFGTTEPWSYAIMESCAGLALLFFFIHLFKNNGTLYQVPGLLPLGLFLLYILFQIIPLPPSIVEFLSPEAFKIHQTNQLITNTYGWMSLTVHTKASVAEFFRYSTYVVYYILTVQLLSRKETLQSTAFVIIFFGAILAFSSILQFYMTEDMVLWFRHSPNNSITMGPYANHNHYAGLMEMIFPIVLGLFLFYRPRVSSTSLFRGIIEIFNQEKANIHILIGSCVLLVVTSIFVSLSRGAMISTCLALIFFTFLLLRRKISKGNTIFLISIIMISALSIGWFGWDQIFERFAALKNAQGVIHESRLEFWADTMDVISQFSVAGAGMGSFIHIYPLYQTFSSKLTVTHAHNDYLELLAEGGIIGFVLAACFIFVLFFKTYKVFSNRRDAFSIYLYMGCATGILSILFHSVTDFNLHIGANGLWFFFTAGIAVCAANTRIRRKNSPTRLKMIESSTIKFTLAILTIVFSLTAMGFNLSNLTGRFYFSNIDHYVIKSSDDPKLIQAVKKVADHATQFDPLESEYPFMQANTSWFLQNFKQAETYFTQSLLKAPLNSRYLNRFARFLARQGHTQRAEMAFEKSMTYDLNNPEYTFEYAAWRLAQKEIKQGVFYMQAALKKDASLFDRALTEMILKGLSPEEIENALPGTPGPSIKYAKFLFNIGRVQDAIERYIDTLDLIENQTFRISQNKTHRNNIKQWQYFDIFWFFMRHKDYRNAMEVMERAEKVLPKNAKVKVALGDLFYRQGITFKAIEKYEHALIFDPTNKQAKKMLKKINP